MLEFDKETKEFVAQLKQSHIYLEYLKAKEEAIKDENLWNRITDYRRNRFDMSSILNGREIYDRIEIFEREIMITVNGLKALGCKTQEGLQRCMNKTLWVSTS